jgi:hypothetical protein
MNTIQENDQANTDTPSLQADLFGSSTQPAQIVTLQIVGDRLVICGAQFVQQVPVRQVRWPRTDDGSTRLIELPDGALLHCPPDPLLSRWRHSASTRPPARHHRLRQTALALMAAALVWAGLPVAAESMLPRVPRQIDRHVGQRLLDRLDAQWLQPSALPVQDQQDWRRRLTDAVAQACPTTRLPDWNLQFRHPRGQATGTGAFSLPDGTVVLLDDQLGRSTLAALCAELGQLQQRQGMRTLARHQPVSLLMGVAFDDFSSTVAVAWPALAQHLPLGSLGIGSVSGGGHAPGPSSARIARR